MAYLFLPGLTAYRYSRNDLDVTDSDREALLRLAAGAARVCRVAEAPDVFGEYHDSEETRALRHALTDLDELLDELVPVVPPAADLSVPTIADILATLLALPDAPGVEDLFDYLNGDQIEKVLAKALAMLTRLVR